ncbi:hypothetical protein V5799_012514 [Amblyomma americanum]|uniref:MADF domain-containing protein n=1 Tax=Amblyomma americanum TaxID=6943 RepID=A0AAQ4EDX1_AMBAM
MASLRATTGKPPRRHARELQWWSAVQRGELACPVAGGHLRRFLVGSVSSNPNRLTGINIGGGDGGGGDGAGGYGAGDGGGGDGARDGGGGDSSGAGPVPSDLDLPYNYEEELFCRRLHMEQRQIKRYRRDLARLRIQQVLFEAKYMELDAAFRGQGVVSVKDKIKSLRDYFVKELKKEAVSMNSPAVDPYVSRWEHFRSWDFLRCVICCDQSMQSSPTVDLPSGPLAGPHCVSDAMLPTFVLPRASRRTIMARAQGVKQERQEVFPEFFVGEEPDMIIPSSPELSSDEDEERPSSTETTSLSPPSSPVPQASCNSGLALRDHALLRSQPKTEQGSSPSSPSYPGRDSVTSPSVPPPKRARPSTSPEWTGINIGGGDGGGADGAGGPVPFDLDLFEEELFFRQLLMELRHMERYRRDLVRLRIRQVLFETKNMALYAALRPTG